MGASVLCDVEKQQGSVLLLCLIVMMLSMQWCVNLMAVFIELQANIVQWSSSQKTQEILLKKAQLWHKFDFQWQDLGQYACIVICQPDCKGTHHGLASFSMNDWTIILRVALPVEGLECTKRHSIQLPNNILYHRFKRS